MAGRSFFPATVTAVFVILTQYIVNGAVTYATTNGDVVLDPQIPPGRLTGILWKHNNDKAVEWESPSDLTAYREFKDATRLDTKTGELTIRGMTSRFSGEYTAECTIETTASQHVFTQRVEVIDPVSQLKVDCEKNGTIITVTCSAAGPMVQYLLSGPGREGATWSEQPIVTSFDATTESVNYTCSAKNPVNEMSRVFIGKDCNSPAGDESLNPVAIAVLTCVLAAVGFVAVGFVIYWCICKKRGYCGNSGDTESGKKDEIPKYNNDASLKEQLLNPDQRNNSGEIGSDERDDIQKTSTPTKDSSTNRPYLQSPDQASWNNGVSSNGPLLPLTPFQRNISFRESAALIDKGIYRTPEEATANEMEKEDTNSLELDDQANISADKEDGLIDETIITSKGEEPKDEASLEIADEAINSSLLHQDPALQPPPKPPRCPEIRSSDAIGQNLQDRLPVREDCGKHEENQEVEETSQAGSEEAKPKYEASTKEGGQSEGEDEKEKEGMIRERLESKKEDEREDEKVKAEGRKGGQDEAGDEEDGTEGGEREEGAGDQAQVEDEETNRDDDDDGENVDSKGMTRETDEAGKEEGSEGGEREEAEKTEREDQAQVEDEGTNRYDDDDDGENIESEGTTRETD